MENNEEEIYNEVARMIDRQSFLPVEAICVRNEYYIKIDYKWEEEYESEDGELVPENSQDLDAIYFDIIEKYNFIQYLKDRNYKAEEDWYSMELKIDLEAYKKFKRINKIENFFED